MEGCGEETVGEMEKWRWNRERKIGKWSCGEIWRGDRWNKKLGRWLRGENDEETTGEVKWSWNRKRKTCRWRCGEM